jgi:hypothetical protein
MTRDKNKVSFQLFAEKQKALTQHKMRKFKINPIRMESLFQ